MFGTTAASSTEKFGPTFRRMCLFITTRRGVGDVMDVILSIYGTRIMIDHICLMKTFNSVGHCLTSTTGIFIIVWNGGIICPMIHRKSIFTIISIPAMVQFGQILRMMQIMTLLNDLF